MAFKKHCILTDAHCTVIRPNWMRLSHLAEALGGVSSGRVRQVLGILVLHGDVVLKERDEASSAHFLRKGATFEYRVKREISLVGDEFCLHSGHMPLLVEGDLTSFRALRKLHTVETGL